MPWQPVTLTVRSSVLDQWQTTARIVTRQNMGIGAALQFQAHRFRNTWGSIGECARDVFPKPRSAHCDNYWSLPSSFSRDSASPSMGHDACVVGTTPGSRGKCRESNQRQMLESYELNDWCIFDSDEGISKLRAMWIKQTMSSSWRIIFNRFESRITVLA